MDIWQPAGEVLQRILIANPFSMSDLKPEVARLTQEHLQFAMFVFVADKVMKSRDCREHETEYYLGHQILRFFLGNEWTNKSIFGGLSGASRLYRKLRRYLKSDSEGVDENVKHQDRVIKLAECLYNLQHVEGMAERIALMEKDSLESIFSEFECARMMAHPTLKLRFVNPTGIAGSDYDAEITSPADRLIYCEIKAKEEASELKQKAIENSIETARKQLPKGQPGLVWIRIPEQWTTQKGAKAIVDAAVQSALSSSDRLVAVLVAFQLWQSEGDEMLTQFRFTWTINEKSIYHGNDIKEAIMLFGSHTNEKWMPLREFVTSRFARMVEMVKSKIANADEGPDRHPEEPRSPDQPQ